MSQREKIRQLITSLSSISYDDENSFDIYIANAKAVVRELFGEYNAYLTYLSYIRCHPISPYATTEENVRFWSRAKHELREFLCVMLDDPTLSSDGAGHPSVAFTFHRERPERPVMQEMVFQVDTFFRRKITIELADHS